MSRHLSRSLVSLILTISGVSMSMAYITDVGFCGAVDSIIGMEYETSLKRLTTAMPERYEVAATYPAQINAVEVTLCDGKATEIKRIKLEVEVNEEMEVNVENSV